MSEQLSLWAPVAELSVRDALSIDALIGDFLTDCSSAGRARLTVDNYRSDLKRLSRYILQQGDPVSVPLIRDYLATLGTLSDSTVKRHFHTLRKFFDWCRLQDLIKDNPMDHFTAPTIEIPLPRPIPERDALLLRRLLRELPLEERALYLLIADTGMRSTEVRHLRVHDVHAERNEAMLLICGKRKQERMLPLLEEWESLALLREHLTTVPAGAVYVFSRKPGDHSQPRLYETIRDRWRALREQLGMDYGLHQWRHLAATSWLEQDISPKAVQEMLGHRDPRTTDRYLLVRPRWLRGQMKRSAPMASEG
jgi:integrase/recombinase XerD